MCRLFVNDPLPLGRKASRDHTKLVFLIFTLLISECTFRTFYYFVSFQSASPAEFFRRVIVVKKEIITVLLLSLVIEHLLPSIKNVVSHDSSGIFHVHNYNEKRTP